MGILSVLQSLIVTDATGVYVPPTETSTTSLIDTLTTIEVNRNA